MFRESLLMAWDNIIGNKMRSFLTMLGIMIGVTSIIALITVVQGVTGQVIEQFNEMGAGKVTVMAYGTVLKSGLNENDIETLNNISYVSGVSPTLSLTGNAVRNGKVMEDVAIEGRNDMYFTNTKDAVSLGRALKDIEMDGNSYVCLIDVYLADELFYGENMLGQTLLVNGKTYTVVGVTQTQNTYWGQNSGRIVLPYKNASQLAGQPNIRNIEIYLYEASKTEEATIEIKSVLDAAFNYNDDSYNIMDFDSILSTMQDMQNMLTAMLAGIASIALLVGGVGIMNMMLVSVSERTEEIGLRKALGAEPRQIQLQFVIEAVLLSLFGGFLGLLLGLLISFGAAVAIGMNFSLSFFAIALGLGFSAIVGIVFGWAPSRKASNLNPIDALRTA